MAASFKTYLREAFNAKPFGMFVPPNWVGLGVFALLGFLNPGFWLLGAGLELAYLHWLVESPRFRQFVDSGLTVRTEEQWQAKLAERVARLSSLDGERFRTIEQRCRALLMQQRFAVPELQSQAEGLGRLLWIYLGLLQTRQTLRQVMNEIGDNVTEKLRRLEAQLRTEDDENVSKSLTGQVEILRQRSEAQKEGRAKIEFLDAEVSRLEEQVELIREQSLLVADPMLVSQRIDEVGSTLGGTTQWIREQQKIYGEVQDIFEDAPAIPLQPPPTL